jgi:hypothetical protein
MEKLANGVGSQYLHTTSEHGVSSVTTADAHTLAASSRLNWCRRRFKWIRPFRRKTKSGFCACAITFLTLCTSLCPHLPPYQRPPRSPSPLQIMHGLAISLKSFSQPVSVTQISETQDVWTNDSLVEGRLLISEIKNWLQINIRIWLKFYMDMYYIASQVYVIQNELQISTIFTTPPSSCKLSDKNHKTA